MRICFVADPGHPNTDRWASHLARALHHDVTVIATQPLPPRERPYAVIPLPVRNRLDYVLLGRRLRPRIEEARPDLVIGYRIQSNGFAAALSGFRPLVLAAQTETIVWPPGNPIYRACTRFAIARADLLQAWGRHMAARLRELGAPEEKILMLPRGVDVNRFTPPQSPVRDPVVVVTRALRPVYNHDLLLRAFALVLKEIPEARLLVAGDGAERARLESLASALGCAARVEFLGHVAERDLPDCLRRAAVYVTLVATEGVSASLLEAMSCGLLPVVVNLPGNCEWVEDGRNGLLIERDQLADPARVAAVILLALRDDALRELAFRINRQETLSRADWDANMLKMDAAYRALVEKN